MGLEEVVDIQITVDTPTVPRAGFGTPLILAYHEHHMERRVLEYAEISDAVADGFDADDPVMRCMAQILKQNPRPKTVKIGRRESIVTQKINFAPVTEVEGLVYSIKITRPDGSSNTATYPVDTGDVVADIVDGLLAAVAAITPSLDLTPTDNSTSFDLTASVNPGDLFDFEIVGTGARLNVDIKITDVSVAPTSPSVGDDLVAIRLEDPDWYGLCLDSNSQAEVEDAAAYAETVTVLFAYNTADFGAQDSSTTTDVFSELQADFDKRAIGIYSGSILSYAGAAWLGEEMPKDIGTSKWNHKTLSGVKADKLTITQTNAIAAKNGNYYTALGGAGRTRKGVTAAGAFIDLIQLTDYLTARISEAVANVIFSNDKLPYTDSSVDLIKGTILGVIVALIPLGISPTPFPTCTAPLVKDVAVEDRALRLLPDVKFQAQVGGAIDGVTIRGKLTV